MGYPDWSKIPYEKMPEWKRQELSRDLKHEIEAIETAVPAKPEGIPCPVCGKSLKNAQGLKIHQAKHNKA